MLNSEALSNLNEGLQSIGESPVKLHSVATKNNIAHGKRKLAKINDTCQAKMSNILGLMIRKFYVSKTVTKMKMITRL